MQKDEDQRPMAEGMGGRGEMGLRGRKWGSACAVGDVGMTCSLDVAAGHRPALRAKDSGAPG